MTSASQNKECRAQSSVFIYDIPYDTSEEMLKALFSEIGQILNFRVLYGKIPNKPKIAFCEYKDPEIALKAIHALNGYEIKGQAINVDLATSEKCKLEIKKLQESAEPVAETPSIPTPDNAAEISKAVASLPAEQMFELMKQMKMCIESNPQEAREFLLQNPQLAFAFLQAQVIMRIVDPVVAVTILNRPPPDENQSESAETPMDQTPSSYPTGMPSVTSDSTAANMTGTQPDLSVTSSSPTGSGSVIMTGSEVISGLMSGQISGTMTGGTILPAMSTPQNISDYSNQFANQGLQALGDQDLRTLPNLGDHDMRAPPALDIYKDMHQPISNQVFRTLGVSSTADEDRPFDPRFRNMQGADRNAGPGFDRPRTTAVDPRTANVARNPAATPRVEDPRKASMAASINARLSAADPSTAPSNAAEEQEKVNLIMQVLQLTDQQIAALPPEQRQSILILREQLARSQAV